MVGDDLFSVGDGLRPVDGAGEDKIVPDDGAGVTFACERSFPEDVLVFRAAPGCRQVLFLRVAEAGGTSELGPVLGVARSGEASNDCDGDYRCDLFGWLHSSFPGRVTVSVGILFGFQAGADVEIFDYDACVEAAGYFPAEVHVGDCIMVD